MFCGKCGHNNPNDARICGNCGSPLATPQQPAQPSTPTQPQQPAQPFTSTQSQQTNMPGMNIGMPQPVQKKSNGGKIAIICGAVVAVIAIVVTLIMTLGGGGNSAKSVAKKYMEAVMKGDGEKAVGYMPDEYFKALAEESYGTVSASEAKKYVKKNIENIKESLEDDYGKYTVKLTVKSVDDVDDLDEVKEEGKELGMKIKDAKEVKVEIKVNGKEGSDTATAIVYMIKIGSKWKAIGFDLDD